MSLFKSECKCSGIPSPILSGIIDSKLYDPLFKIEKLNQRIFVMEQSYARQVEHQGAISKKIKEIEMMVHCLPEKKQYDIKNLVRSLNELVNGG